MRVAHSLPHEEVLEWFMHAAQLFLAVSAVALVTKVAVTFLLDQCAKRSLVRT